MTGPLKEELQSSLGAAYTIERELGGGGMSRVFVATETRYGRRVVVKVLAPELTAGVSTDRFEREISLAASLQQANIVPVLTSGDVHGLPFYTMPFVEGRSLRARLSDGAIPITEVVSILRDLARALAYAHDRQVVHRDIKPDNVLLSGGTAVVTDFGIAKAISAARTSGDRGDETSALTQLGTALGTPAYMAPEQAAGDPSADHRSDLYAFGCLAYELLAGQPPFHGLPPQRLLAAHMGERPVPVQELRADTPPALAALVMQCLEKDASRRPQRAQEIAQALDGITSGSSTTLPPVLHGRVSLAAALGIWVVVFIAAWILAKAAIVGIGLPGWVLPGALMVAGLGLPAVLATWWVQKATQRALLTTPGSRRPASTMQTFALKASPHVSWRRTWRGGVAAAVTFVVLVTAFMGARALGIGPAGSLVGKGVVKQNDRVVLATVATTGRDSTMAAVLTEAFRSDLTQSRFISLLAPSAVRSALSRMQRPADTVLTAALAREVAAREGAKLVVAAEVAPLGTGYVLNARLLDPATGDPLESARATASDADDLLSAVSELTRTLRERIGESMRSIQNSPRLERVTTPSFEAFRKYSEAIEWSEGVRYDANRARALLLEAVALDSTFAMAWRKLGWLAFDPASQMDYISRAFRHREKLTDLERHQVEGSYYWIVLGDRDRGITSHLEAARIDSTVQRTMGNLAMLYGEKHDFERSLDWAMRTERLDSTQVGAYSFPPIIALKRFEMADSVIELSRRILGDSSPGTLYLTQWLHWSREQWDSIPAVLRRYGRSGGQNEVSGAQFLSGALAVLRGRLREGEAGLAASSASSRKAGVPLPPIVDALAAAQVDFFVREDFSTVSRLDSAVAATRFEDIPPANQFFLDLGVAYAIGRRPDRARSMLARYDNVITDSMQRRRESTHRNQALAWIALADGRAEQAIALFRESAVPECDPCTLAGLALAFDNSGQADSALHYLTAYDQRGPSHFLLVDALWRPFVLRRLGELHEQRGEIEKAIPYYRRFVDAWRNADPELKPKVDAVREKLRRFAQTERR